MIGVLVCWVVIGWIMVRVGISVLWFSVCVLVSVCGARNCEQYFFTTLIIPGHEPQKLGVQYHGITQLRTTNQQVHWVVQVINLT